MRPTEVRVLRSSYDSRDRLAIVELLDPDYSHLAIAFMYKLRGKSESLELGSVHVDRKAVRPGQELGPEISAYDLREGFPWARWADVARDAAVTEIITESTRRKVEYAKQVLGVTDEVLTGSGDVSSRDMDAETGKPPTNRRESHLRDIADEYRRNLNLGLRDPAAQIARDHVVKPATARTWVRRARQLGLIGPAKGPTPGEVTPPKKAAPSPSTPRRDRSRG